MTDVVRVDFNTGQRRKYSVYDSMGLCKHFFSLNPVFSLKLYCSWQLHVHLLSFRIFLLFEIIKILKNLKLILESCFLLHVDCYNMMQLFLCLFLKRGDKLFCTWWSVGQLVCHSICKPNDVHSISLDFFA